MSAIIDQIVAVIRGARYGRDVRESIAHGIEVIDDVAEGARDSATASATDAQNYAHSADQSASNAHTSEVNANGSATTASNKATEAESWAVGGTGSRSGEDTNNAKYWSEQAQGAVTGVTSFNGRIGAVVPTNGDYSINQISNNGASGQVPLSDGNGGWTMGTPSTVGDLDDLSDVNITSPSDGQTLVYDSANQKWANGFGGVNVAPVFDETVAYKRGDYVTYNGNTYWFKYDKTAGTWDGTKVEQQYAMGARVTAGKKSGTTLGLWATAEGGQATASGDYSHAEGSQTTASTIYCHAEGQNTVASNQAAHAEGTSTKAQHRHSHAEGHGTQTGADCQHVQGEYNVGKSTTLFEIGNGTADNASSRSNAFEVDTSGNVVASGTITDGNGNVLGGGVNRKDIAYVESGTTASRSYSVGQLVYVSDTLYRVSSAIQNGQPFTVGTNIVTTSVGDELSSINSNLTWQSVNLPTPSTSGDYTFLTFDTTSTYPKEMFIRGYVGTNSSGNRFAIGLSALRYYAPSSATNVPFFAPADGVLRYFYLTVRSNQILLQWKTSANITVEFVGMR